MPINMSVEYEELKNRYVEAMSILESIEDCLDGKEPSDFMQSYPIVDSVWRLNARIAELEKDRDSEVENCRLMQDRLQRLIDGNLKLEKRIAKLTGSE